MTYGTIWLTLVAVMLTKGLIFGKVSNKKVEDAGYTLAAVLIVTLLTAWALYAVQDDWAALFTQLIP